VKQFAEGLFKGTVMPAIKQRGRYLYHIVYEDGDEEDLNDKEFKEAYDLCNEKNSIPLQRLVVDNTAKDSDNEIDGSGGESEVSEYDSSDAERDRNKKKRRTGPSKKLKEKAKNGGRNKRKEEETTNESKSKHPMAINVEAILKSGSKTSVTNKTIAAMTSAEQQNVIGTAGKTLMKQAKKGLRKYINCFLLALCLWGEKRNIQTLDGARSEIP
jgi:hypothetical protein